MIVTEHGIDLKYALPTLCGGSSSWQCSRVVYIRKRESVCLSHLVPLWTQTFVCLSDLVLLWAPKLGRICPHHHPRVLPPNTIHVNLETKFPEHENFGNIFNPQHIHLLRRRPLYHVPFITAGLGSFWALTSSSSGKDVNGRSSMCSWVKKLKELNNAWIDQGPLWSKALLLPVLSIWNAISWLAAHHPLETKSSQSKPREEHSLEHRPREASIGVENLRG